MWKDFFYFSRGERLGILLLLALVCGVVIVGYMLHYGGTPTEVDRQTFMEDYARFSAQLQHADSLRNVRYAEARRTATQRRKTVILQPFDPNIADSIEFIRLGLPSWMAANILKYRAKGGVFRTPESFRKVYGLTDEQYETLLPYIYIEESFRRKATDTIRLAEAPKVDYRSDSLPRPVKYPEGTLVNLNTADTTELMKIPGIGSAYARKIVSYRKRLGGYCHVEQLEEIGLDAVKFSKWFHLSEDNRLEPIKLNRSGIERLRAHPYLNFYQAKVIVEHRKKKGRWKRLDQLSFYDEFTADDIERIRPYVSFE